MKMKERFPETPEMVNAKKEEERLKDKEFIKRGMYISRANRKANETRQRNKQEKLK